jgi:pimeloyl-ACP methyl ester carboxylesterase
VENTLTPASCSISRTSLWRDIFAAAVFSLIKAFVLVTSVSGASVRINEARFVTLGGVEQWITIRGADRSSPVPLILHGGPGDAQSALVSTYEPLEHDFVVVQWDQRGAGKTRARATDQTRSASLELLTRDGIELTEYLRTYLQKTNVILVGHSWGSFLGVHIVEQHPELFRTFVGTGQVVSWKGMVEGQYRYTLERARATTNASAVAELEALGVPVSDRFDHYLTMRRWLNGYNDYYQWRGTLRCNDTHAAVCRRSSRNRASDSPLN